VTVATLLASALSLLHVCKANHGEFLLFLGMRTPCRHHERRSRVSSFLRTRGHLLALFESQDPLSRSSLRLAPAGCLL